FASISPWEQTDWSGGAHSGVITTTTNTYNVATGIDTTTAGQISLQKTAGWATGFDAWEKRAPITIVNTGNALDDYQVRLSVTYDSDMQADFDDIRFANSAGTELDYWIETYTDSTSAIVWIEVDALSVGSTQIWIYYGNDGVSSASSGEDTFLFFDDFSGSDLDLSKWEILGNSGFYSHESGELRVNGNGRWNTGYVVQNLFDREDVSFEFKYRWTSSNGSYDAFMMGWHNSGTAPSYTQLMYAYYNSGSGNCVTNCPINVYELGSSRGVVSGKWTSGTQYTNRVKMKAAGGAIYEQSTDGGSSWITSYTSNFSTAADLRPGFALHSGTHMIDDARVRKWAASEPTLSVGVEENIYPTSGTLTSDIFDAEFPADWETLTYNSAGAGVVSVKVRTSAASDMSGAAAWSTCPSIISGTDTSSTSCVNDQDQYVQYQVILEPSNASTPTFEDTALMFSASDQVLPVSNASSVFATGLSAGDWIKTAPTISWTAGADNNGGSGILGYCVAVDEVTALSDESESSSLLDPALTGGVLTGLDDGVASDACPFIVTSTSWNTSSVAGLTLQSGKHYFVSLKAVDVAGNIWTGSSAEYQDLFSFRYDNTRPTNVGYISAPSTVFGSVDDMTFNWPSSGANTSNDTHSGVLGWQYSLDAATTWRGSETQAGTGVEYIPDTGSTYSYNLTTASDGSFISEGVNTVYFRTIDVAGNTSSPTTYRTTPLEFGGAAPTFAISCSLTTGVTITPNTNTSNAFGLSWDSATPTAGNTVSSYYYMINTTPPSNRSTLTTNSSLYHQTNTPSVGEQLLAGAVKGANTVYVVAVDSNDNYSPSNCVKGVFTLDSTLPDPVRNLSVADSSIKASEIWRASLSWDEPAYKGTGSLTYTVERSTDNTSWEEVATTTGTSYTDTVDASRVYYYRIGTHDSSDASKNAPTYSTSVSVLPTGKFTEAAFLASGPEVINVTTKNATITWSTDRTSDSKISYGLESNAYFAEEASKSDFVTGHEISLTNLNPGTTYYYRAKWTDEDGNIGESDERSFTTSPAPVVKEVAVTNVGINSAVVNFTVIGASDVSLYYGESTSFGGIKNSATSSQESSYTFVIDGLLDGTKYYYKINAFDSEGDEYEGTTLDFTTLPRPQIQNVRVQEVKGAAQPMVLVTWQTNTPTSSILSYFPTGNPSNAQEQVSTQLKAGAHRMLVKGLAPQQAYSLFVRGIDVAGNEASSDAQSFTTATDTRPPQISDMKVEGSTAPSSGGSGQESLAQFVVAWSTDEPSTSQVEFGEGTGSSYSQKTQQDNNLTNNHLVIVSNLTPSKVYHLRALSIDEAGNQTESIDTVSITPKVTDSALDLVITNLQQAFGFLRNVR
ncbi:DUF2341 domain-containing protein, partial [Candidatus Woesebacteria bacterium]|nr:DUF2341 domain-containing protein [Candidatus Woesebacteria bacterium]